LLDGVRASIGAPEPEDEPTLDNVQQVADGEGEVSKTELLRAVRTAKLPANILEAAAGEGGLDDVFKATATTVHELQKEVDELRPKAVLGDTFIKELRADALHWFTMQAKDPGSDVGVNVEKIERLLDLCGTNAELIKEQRDMYRDLARAKFPEAVRRSTHPDGGVNERHEVAVAPELPVPGNLGAKRIHG
jgi:hypothetical protein